MSKSDNGEQLGIIAVGLKIHVQQSLLLQVRVFASMEFSDLPWLVPPSRLEHDQR